MKFRSPETGEVFDVTDGAPGTGFCSGIRCYECPLRSAPYCKKFIHHFPHEAARLMGYEVVEDDHIPQVEKKEANMDKPRICEVLGVEVDEEFTYDFGENQVNRGSFKIGADGNRYYKDRTDTWYHCFNEKDLLVIINHPDRIIRKPRFTEQEVEDAKILARALLADGFERDKMGDVFSTSKTASRTLLDSRMFPSIQPGQSYTLDEIIGGAQ